MYIKKVISDKKQPENILVLPEDSSKISSGKIYLGYNPKHGFLYKLHSDIGLYRQNAEKNGYRTQIFRWISLYDSVSWTSIDGRQWETFDSIQQALNIALEAGWKIVEVERKFFDNLVAQIVGG